MMDDQEKVFLLLFIIQAMNTNLHSLLFFLYGILKFIVHWTGTLCISFSTTIIIIAFEMLQYI